MDPTVKFVATEEYRLEQGGMGYLQFHAAVAWVRQWLRSLDKHYVEHGSTGWVEPVKWTVDDSEGKPLWLTFDLTSVGHLQYSLHGQSWRGMDVTYHPATETTKDRWDTLMLRVKLWRAE